jgi:hypothetical protein
VNYSELRAAILAAFPSPEVEQSIDTFILTVEAEANRRLVDRQMNERTAYEDFSTETVPLPEDFAGVVSFWLSDGSPLDFLAADDLAERVSTAQGKPRYYTITGDVFGFLPAPDGEYTAYLRYRQRIPALSSSATTNWLIERHPDIYLNGCLVEAGLFNETPDPRVPAWKSKLEDAFEQAARDHKRHSAPSQINARARSF